MRHSIIALCAIPFVSARFVRRSSSLVKGLIVSNALELSVWSKDASEFDFVVNYGASIGNLDLTGGQTFIPMLRRDESASTFSARAEAAIKNGAKYISDQNEPNEKGVSGKEGAANFKKVIQPILKKHGIKAVVGQISANDAGLKYIKDFLAACSGCDIQAVGFHWYNPADRSTEVGMTKLKSWISQVKSVAGGHPLWVALIKQAMAVFRKTSSIKVVFGFPHLTDGVYVAGTSLTAAGKAYLAA